MSIGSVIRYNLLQEGNTDQTAQDVYLSNTTCYSSSADVPLWMYQSFSTILGCASGQLDARIIANEGEAKIPTSPCIVIETSDDVESVYVKDSGLQSDMSGCVTADIKILVKNLVTNKDITRVQACLNKLWYILDGNMRQLGTPVRYIDLEVNTNEFTSGSEFRCYFIRKVLPLASEGYIEFSVIAEWNFGLSFGG